MAAVIRHLLISSGHNFLGHHGVPAGTHPICGVPTVTCRAGQGLEGDRFFGHRPDFRGQITFFGWETYEAVKRKFNVPALSPGAFRRNVLVEGIDLGALIGRRFSLGGVVFEGMEESRPCHWMNRVVGPGAEEWLRGQGGLRAKILTDGQLAVGPAELSLFQEVA